jgi:phosphoribosylanthranilate isomerase
LPASFAIQENKKMLTTTVKISNVTNLSDARYCAGMGVDMLGFSVDPDSPRYVAPKKFEEIRNWLVGVKLVAESALTEAQVLLEALKEYRIDALQVEDPNLLPYLRSDLSLPLLLRVNVDTYDADELDALMSRYASAVDFFLLESEQDAPLTEDWKDFLEQLAGQYPILVGFGLNDEQEVRDLLTATTVAGIALRGSEEIRPGFKDFGAMMDILEALEEE